MKTAAQARVEAQKIFAESEREYKAQMDQVSYEVNQAIEHGRFIVESKIPLNMETLYLGRITRTLIELGYEVDFLKNAYGNRLIIKWDQAELA